jgi:MoaA/NifB/PqqE/SkfB family radical SAM enzyme
MATFIPTKKCNLRCHHCLRGDYDDLMLDINTFERFIIDCNAYDSNNHQKFGNLFHDIDYIVLM